MSDLYLLAFQCYLNHCKVRTLKLSWENASGMQQNAASVKSAIRLLPRRVMAPMLHCLIGCPSFGKRRIWILLWVYKALNKEPGSHVVTGEVHRVKTSVTERRIRLARGWACLGDWLISHHGTWDWGFGMVLHPVRTWNSPQCQPGSSPPKVRRSGTLTMPRLLVPSLAVHVGFS